MDRLRTQLARLVELQVISASRAQELTNGARADRLDGCRRLRSLLRGPQLRRRRPGAGCGDHARLLFWDGIGSTGRKLAAVASLVVPALGGAALIKGRARPQLGRILLALACCGAGFAYLVVFEHDVLQPPARWHRIAKFVNWTEDDPPA
jgi:hypothetical protein